MTRLKLFHLEKKSWQCLFKRNNEHGRAWTRGFNFKFCFCFSCRLGDDLEVKISNLGLARDISKENYRMNKKTRLPIKWMAPESLSHFVFSEKSDVVSMGSSCCKLTRRILEAVV